MLPLTPCSAPGTRKSSFPSEKNFRLLVDGFPSQDFVCIDFWWCCLWCAVIFVGLGPYMSGVEDLEEWERGVRVMLAGGSGYLSDSSIAKLITTWLSLLRLMILCDGVRANFRVCEWNGRMGNQDYVGMWS